MSVDQIKEKFSQLLLLCSLLLLACCQQQQTKSRSGPAPTASTALAQNKLSMAPPLPLKQPGVEITPALHVLGSLRSRDRAGHRRLQLYLQHDLPADQAFYWQVISLYRSQYDVIWVYLRSSGQTRPDAWNGKAAWFAPELPKGFHIPGFKPKAEHDGLYWTDS